MAVISPQSDIRVVYPDNDTVVIERTTGADPTLPVVIFCHGAGQDAHNLYGPRANGITALANGVFQHSIASGYKWVANAIGGTLAFSNSLAMSDIDKLYTLAGTSKVILTGHSMGGCSSLQWVSQNMSKVAGWINFSGASQIEWLHDKLDDIGNSSYNYGFIGDLTTAVEDAWGGLSGYNTAMPTQNPTHIGSAQLATLQANKDKLWMIIPGSDSILYTSYSYRVNRLLGCGFTIFSDCNHGISDGSTWNDEAVTRLLDKFSGRGSYPSVPTYTSVIMNTPGLQHYYKCDETSGTTLVDSKGTENLTVSGTGNVMGEMGLVSDAPKGSFSTFASSNGIAKTSSHTPLAGAGDFSYEVWMATNAPAAGRYFIGETSGSNTTPLFALSNDTTTSSYLRVYVRNDAGTAVGTTYTSTSIAGCKPHHYVVTGNRTTNLVNVYMDGQLVIANQAYPSNPTSVNRFAIGGLSRTTDSNYFSGFYQHVATYNVELSADTILNHYNTGINKDAGLF